MASKEVEIEVKLAVPNSRVLARALSRLGFTLESRETEQDSLFDTPSMELRRSRRALRLRKHGSKWKLTFKGPPATGSRYKSRPEIETSLADGDRCRRILEGIGYREIFRYEKRRSTYRQRTGRGVLTLDRTPIGTFLELEGSPAWIDRTARALGFSADDYITASYAQLYFDYCQRNGLEPANMVFQK